MDILRRGKIFTRGKNWNIWIAKKEKLSRIQEWIARGQVINRLNEKRDESRWCMRIISSCEEYPSVNHDYGRIKLNSLLRYFVSFLDVRSVENLLSHITSRLAQFCLKLSTFWSLFNEETFIRNRVHFSLGILPRVESRQEVIQGRVHSNTYRINPDDEEGEEWIVCDERPR